MSLLRRWFSIDPRNSFHRQCICVSARGRWQCCCTGVFQSSWPHNPTKLATGMVGRTMSCEIPVPADCRLSNLRVACSIAAIGNQRATGDFTVTPLSNRATSMTDGSHSHGAFVSQVRGGPRPSIASLNRISRNSEPQWCSSQFSPIAWRTNATSSIKPFEVVPHIFLFFPSEIYRRVPSN